MQLHPPHGRGDLRGLHAGDDDHVVRAQPAGDGAADALDGRRAQRRLEDGSYSRARLEAKAFGVFAKIEKRFFGGAETVRSWVDPGHKTGTSANDASRARSAMTEATKG